MPTVLLILAALTLLFWIAVGIDLMAGNRSVKFLKNVIPASKGPRVSIIIPARNEEKKIEEALLSVLMQDYPHLEFIVVNDRSTDGTGAILARMASANPKLRVIDLRELPAGWLGKNYALYHGAHQATGELLLFTDADIVMHASSVSAAVAYMLDKQLDHLPLWPEVRMPGLMLGILTSAFAIFFSLYIRPWKARDPKSPRSVGVGAFNLVRASVYRAIGTHQALAMRPDDDIKLGKLIKQGGYRQELLFGHGMISVEWYSSVSEMIDGLMKNGFASVDYNLATLVAGSIAMFLLLLWPFIGWVLTHGVTRILNALIILVVFVLIFDGARFHGYKRWYAVGFPVCAALFLGIIWKSALTTLANDGIYWRGTHYSLAELKANRV